VRAVAVREAQLLRQLDHPHIVQLHDLFRSRNNLYIILEYIQFNALQLIQLHPNGMPIEQLQWLGKQLTSALAYMHSKKVLHRDIRPENILVSRDGVLKLADFGFSRHVPQLQEGRLTGYVCSRWYRAPELLLGSQYGAAADVWALGCVLAEMAIGQPLFAGSTDVEQLSQMARMVGLTASQRASFEQEYGGTFPPGLLSPLYKLVPQASAELITLLNACLQPDPKARPTAAKLLEFDLFVSASSSTLVHMPTEDEPTRELLPHAIDQQTQAARLLELHDASVAGRPREPRHVKSQSLRDSKDDAMIFGPAHVCSPTLNSAASMPLAGSTGSVLATSQVLAGTATSHPMAGLSSMRTARSLVPTATPRLSAPNRAEAPPSPVDLVKSFSMTRKGYVGAEVPEEIATILSWPATSGNSNSSEDDNILSMLTVPISPVRGTTSSTAKHGRRATLASGKDTGAASTLRAAPFNARLPTGIISPRRSPKA